MRYLFLVVLLLPLQQLLANELSFIGLRGDEWQIYSWKPSAANEEPTAILAEIKNPRAFSRYPKKALVAYIDQSGLLQLFDQKTQKSVPLQKEDDKSRFTQLRFDDSGKLWAVKLSGGNSRQTQLVSFDVAKEKGSIARTAVAKRGAQFDPYADGSYLYYSAAHCVDDCDPMIWEIWRKDLSTGKQRQFTLGDAVSREPVIAGGLLYFISNRDHYYHLWRMTPEPAARAAQLTNGSVTDTGLAPLGDSAIFFVRRTPSKVKIMRYDIASGKLIALDLPNWLQDIRELEAYE
jgi:Tol biopolymer transport system component